MGCSEGSIYFIYDDYKLIGEYNEDGTAIKEYIYLEDTPIAIIENNKVYYIYADHLNTPRRVAISEDNTIVWKWESKPFGEDKPNEDPDRDNNTFTLNLRFPGQYFDIESGFSYNINRYYSPTLGRYMQSDPIGLDGGENSFVYVGDNPLVRVDESGEIWDTVADIGFILYDVGSGAYHYATGDDEAFKTDMSALAADSAAAMVPFATGAGIAVRAGSKLSNVATKLKGIYINMPLRNLTHSQLVKVFGTAGFKLSNHAIMRLKDKRLYNIGFKTPNDVQQIWRKGKVVDAGKGAVGYVYKNAMIVVNPKTNTIITIKPVK